MADEATESSFMRHTTSLVGYGDDIDGDNNDDDDDDNDDY